MLDPIPAFDYRRQSPVLRSEIEAAMRRVCDSGRLILGPEVEQFEAEFAAYVGAKHAVGLASGTDAIILALRVLGIGPGDEVITVANAGIPTVAAIRAAGAAPRFVDVDPRTLQMDPRQAADAIRPRTRCLLPVHLHGHPADMDAILAVARRAGLSVVEDCAQAHGTQHRRRHVGTFGEIGCFSFYPTKNLGAYGDGGLCITNDHRLADALRQQRMYGFRAQRIAESEGLNSRLDELQAAILRIKLRHLDEALETRAEIARRYQTELADVDVMLPATAPHARHSWHQFVIRIPDRGAMCRALDAAGIGYGIHYPVPAHRMPAYRHLVDSSDSLLVTEDSMQQVLSLPLFPGLRENERLRVVEVVRQAALADRIHKSA